MVVSNATNDRLPRATIVSRGKHSDGSNFPYPFYPREENRRLNDTVKSNEIRFHSQRTMIQRVSDAILEDTESVRCNGIESGNGNRI